MTPTALVTRPQPQADDWVARLRAAGLAAEALPLLAIAPAPDPAAVRSAFGTLPTQALVMFVSPNAVTQALACMHGWSWPVGLRAAAVGPGTVAALRAAGVPAAAITAPAAPPYESEALWALLASESWVDQPVLIVRGDGGREWMGDTLRAAGAAVQTVQAYGRGDPVWSAAERACAQAALAAPAAHCWLLSSSEAVAALARLLPGADWAASQAIASHARIAQAACTVGFGRVRVVPPELAAVRDALPTMQGHDCA